MIGSVSAPILAAAFGFPTVVVIVYSALAALIVFRHKANIKRLMNGTETTFSFRRKSDKDA
jgi:glycerol-3-phosphate acyltransferase PlsY